MTEYGELNGLPRGGGQNNAGKGKQRKISCFHCEFFHVTWDPNMPKGCKVFAYKGKELPSVTVFKSTGKNCIAFKRKSNC